MKIVFGWMKLTRRVKQVITGVRNVCAGLCKLNAPRPCCLLHHSDRSNSCNPTPDAELAAGQIISLAVMSNAFLIIYSPHQHLTSQGKPVYSKWAKEEGARQIAFKRS